MQTSNLNKKKGEEENKQPWFIIIDVIRIKGYFNIDEFMKAMVYFIFLIVHLRWKQIKQIFKKDIYDESILKWL